MRKVQFVIFFIIYILTTMLNFGQTKQSRKLNIKDKNNINIDSLIKFDPTEQVSRDLKERDTTWTDISIIDYLPPKHYRSEIEMNLLLQKYYLNNDSVFYYGTENENPESVCKRGDKL